MSQSKPSPLEGEGRPKAGERGYSVRTLGQAKRLRREMTEAERRLWTRLRGGRLAGFKFRRYIAGFCCAERKVIVDADGSQHSAENPRDVERDAFLVQSGYRVLRFWNSDILRDTENVMSAIHTALTAPSPTSTSTR